MDIDGVLRRRVVVPFSEFDSGDRESARARARGEGGIKISSLGEAKQFCSAYVRTLPVVVSTTPHAQHQQQTRQTYPRTAKP